MIDTCRRFIQRYPNALVLLAGLWIAAMPVTLMWYVEDHVWASGAQPTGVNAFLAYLHGLRYAEPVAVVITFLGFGISLAAIWKMIRPWVRP